MNHVHVKALERASDLQGGPQQLADCLGIPLATLTRLMQGKVDLDPDLFVRVVDLITSADLSSFVDPLVLVVEDDPATAYSFARLVRQLGYRVATATDGQSALAQIRALRPMVAFIDLRLPDANGREIAEIVRAENLQTRVVAVTAYGDPQEERDLSLAAGFEKHFAKPVDPKSVEGVLPRRTRHT
jgi:CheY-like chemotaxis protein